MTHPLTCQRTWRPVPTAIVVCVLAALVLGGLYAYQAARPCGAGVGDPQDAVAGVLTAIDRGDDRSLCQRLGQGYVIPARERDVLQQWIEEVGSADELTVKDLHEQQVGAEHVLAVSTASGEVVAQFQTIPGERGATVVAVTTSPGRW